MPRALLLGFYFLVGLHRANAKPLKASMVVVQGLFWLNLTPALSAADPPVNSVLHLADGNVLAGKLCGSKGPGVICWQSPHFTLPFEFPLGAVGAVNSAVSEQPPAGDYRFQLVNNDLLHGRLVGLTESEIEKATADGLRKALQDLTAKPAPMP